MTLKAEIVARITRGGPIGVAEYMAECLMHPHWGYYSTRDPFGAAGDFVTAPEISQMFGEMVALCLAQAWLDQGRPARILLTELGPGRGTLMADMMRTFRSVRGLAEATEIHLVETSPALRARQAATLAGFAPAWHEDLADLPDGPLFLVANEFFDALPVRQFQRARTGWSERQIGVTDGELHFGLSPPEPLAALSGRIADTREGDVVEICPASAPIACEIARRVCAQGGVGLVIDYGGWHSRGDTLQALRAHVPTDPLCSPGEADLTAHVDFEALASGFAAGGAAITAMTPQGVFLERLGITRRAQALAGQLTGSALQEHVAAHRRLTHPAEMGNLFQVMACFPPDRPTPPGLDPA